MSEKKSFIEKWGPVAERVVLYAGLAFGFYMLYWGFRFIFTVFG
jgi:hypothetical protein